MFARFNCSIALPDGSTTTARKISFFRLSGGKIQLNDVMMVPNVLKVLGPLLAPSRDTFLNDLRPLHSAEPTLHLGP